MDLGHHSQFTGAIERDAFGPDFLDMLAGHAEEFRGAGEGGLFALLDKPVGGLRDLQRRQLRLGLRQVDGLDMAPMR